MDLRSEVRSRDLDEVINDLWQLPDLKCRRRLHIDLSVPLVTDYERDIAKKVVEAVIEKHAITLHDATMLLRAGVMTLLHGYLSEWTKRTPSQHGVA